MRRAGIALLLASALLPMPITAPAQETQPPDWDQICRNAAPDTPLRNRCGQIESACILRKLTSQLSGSAYSPQACLAEGMNAAQSVEDQQTCRQSDDFQAVISACSRTLASGNDSIRETVEDLSHRGIALSHTGQDESAEADFTRAIKLGPSIPSTEGTLEERNSLIGAIYTERCLTHLNRKQWDAMVTDCTQAITLKTVAPFLEPAYSSRGLAYAMKGTSSPQMVDYYNRALADLNEALVLDPNDATALNVRGSIKIFFGRMRNAPDQIASGEAERARARAINATVDSR